MKVKDILNLGAYELENKLRKEYIKKVEYINITIIRLLHLYQEGARTSGLDLEDQYVSIEEYIDYLEEKKLYLDDKI